MRKNVWSVPFHSQREEVIETAEKTDYWVASIIWPNSRWMIKTESFKDEALLTTSSTLEAQDEWTSCPATHRSDRGAKVWLSLVLGAWTLALTICRERRGTRPKSVYSVGTVWRVQEGLHRLQHITNNGHQSQVFHIGTHVTLKFHIWGLSWINSCFPAGSFHQERGEYTS